MRGFDGEIHERTNRALIITWLGAFYGGAVAIDHSLALGFTIGGVVAIVALWYTPPAETVAIQWREYQRLEDGDSR